MRLSPQANAGKYLKPSPPFNKSLKRNNLRPLRNYNTSQQHFYSVQKKPEMTPLSLDRD
jgi:hypothetical protein